MCAIILSTKQKESLKKPKDSQKVIKGFIKSFIKSFEVNEINKKRLRRPNQPKFKRPNPWKLWQLSHLYKYLKKYRYALKEGQNKCYQMKL